MPPNLALLLCTLFVFWMFRRDKKLGIKPPKELFWPSLWYVVCASRPIGYWLLLWNVPMPFGGGGDDPTEGSPIDRYFFLVLLLIGLWILSKRKFPWGKVLSQNAWVTALFILMAVSILWSQYSFVSFKRYVKAMGSLTMALVVLSDPKPLEAMFVVLRRCLYIHLPMSILCTRYFRDIGVSYTYSGMGQSWQGIATSKNTLGQIAVIGIIYFAWELKKNWPQWRWKNLHLLYFLMAVYLIKGAGDSVSMTSVSVSAFALMIFFRIQSLRRRPQAIRGFVWTVFLCTFALIALVMTHSVVFFQPDSIFGKMITTFGRDITLTDRTNIWNDVYAAASRNPLLGVGYGGFWIGRLSNIPWAAGLTWVLGQGHSGYVDTYLQIGIVGLCFMAAVLFSTVPKLLDRLKEDFDFNCFRITMLLTIMYVNITESTYLRGDHQFWFMFMLVVWQVPSKPRPPEPELPVYYDPPEPEHDYTYRPAT